MSNMKNKEQNVTKMHTVKIPEENIRGNIFIFSNIFKNLNNSIGTYSNATLCVTVS